ncbi:MAG: leucyl aminopeptidase [Alphaproteobacteria bacterium]
MKIEFAAPTQPESGALVLGVFEDAALTPSAEELDTRLDGTLRRAIGASRFSGKARQFLDVLAPAGAGADRVVLVGLGKPAALDQRAAEDLGGAIYGHLAGSGAKRAAVALDPVEGAPLAVAEIAARLAFGSRLASYRFDLYRTKQKPEDRPSLERLTVTLDGHAAAKKAFAGLDKVSEGVFLARDLVSEPPNVLYPATFADRAKELSKLGVEIDVLSEKDMRKLGMGALLGVGAGSQHDSFVVVMQWNGGKKGRPPVAFIGKGVTFDTGGISIKPAAGMEDMKWDMGGAAAVVGLMKALAGRKAKVNAVGVIGLAENMPSGTAQRPGDVVTSMSGQTIEVINTDAEGRLILADVLWYTQDRFKPEAMIDLATLTGAIIIALGHHNAGLFASDDALAERLIASGRAAGETVWRMPMDEAYDKQIASDIADMKNVGGRDGGSVSAAQFLKRFCNDVPWAHLDIAGVAWGSKAKPTVPKGGTGFGVRLLDRFVADHYEQ